MTSKSKKSKVETDKAVYDSEETRELVEGDVKIGTKEEAYWTDVKEKTLKEITTLKKMLKFNEAILSMSEQKIEDELRRKTG